MNSKVPPTSTVKSSSKPSILEPFLPIVKLFCCQFPPSAISIVSPKDGFVGSVIVKEPPLVSAMI